MVLAATAVSSAIGGGVVASSEATVACKVNIHRIRSSEKLVCQTRVIHLLHLSFSCASGAGDTEKRSRCLRVCCSLSKLCCLEGISRSEKGGKEVSSIVAVYLKGLRALYRSAYHIPRAH